MNNDLIRLQGDITYHYEIPWFERWTTSLSVNGGYITNTKVDSFFHFFNGGMSGLKGYPFYSIEGTRSALFDFSFRVPMVREKHIKLGWFILQNSVVGAIFQFGDSWREKTDQMCFQAVSNGYYPLPQKYKRLTTRLPFGPKQQYVYFYKK